MTSVSIWIDLIAREASLHHDKGKESCMNQLVPTFNVFLPKSLVLQFNIIPFCFLYVSQMSSLCNSVLC